MTTYNFTVRATDNLGAYSDRQFGVTVNNTNAAKFVVTGESGSAYSYDGINWTNIPIPGACVAYGNNKWIMTVNNGATGSVIKKSTDGVNWFDVSPITWTNHADSISAVKGGFVRYIPDHGTNGPTWFFGSSSYSEWGRYNENDNNATSGGWVSAYIAGTALGNYLIGATYFKGSFYGVWAGNTLFTTATAYGLTGGWGGTTTLTQYADGGGGTTNGMLGGGVKAYNNKLFYYGYDIGLQTSVDGTNWTTVIPSSTMNVRSLCYGNGVLLAIGTFNNSTAKLMRSYDGVNWSDITNSTMGTKGQYNKFNSIAFYNGTWVIITNSTNISGGANLINTGFYSQDNGTTWTQINIPGIGLPWCIESKLPMNTQ